MNGTSGTGGAHVASGKNPLRDKLDDDILDLSLMQLQEVPVKDISGLTRGTTLDLSNNQLRTLPVVEAFIDASLSPLSWQDSFVMLSHLVKLDLSKNQIYELPEYFGQLRHLRHLDLYSNQLERLPVSLAQLKHLKWLDLKHNPLVPALQQAAGPCITASDCSMCAKKVVVLLQSMQSQLDRERQKHALQEQQAEQRRQAQADVERERMRAKKKAAKERRKEENQAQNARDNYAHEMERPQARERDGGQANGHAAHSTGSSSTRNAPRGWCYSLFMVLMACVFISLAMGISMIWIYTGGKLDQRNIERALPVIRQDIDGTVMQVGRKLEDTFQSGLQIAAPYWQSLKANTLSAREEFWRRQNLVSTYVNKNLGPTACAYGNQLKAHLIWLRSLLIDAWLRVKPQLIEFWHVLVGDQWAHFLGVVSTPMDHRLPDRSSSR
eukprot:TCALIF_01908-PA protein Name:"Similar to Lrrc59 Leucine-rich repeat-containing protein 59 (Mus musculus)" AED:0.07 eAED:0.07 QI:265/0.5/0.4/1/1/1/5/0/438